MFLRHPSVSYVFLSINSISSSGTSLLMHGRSSTLTVPHAPVK